MTGDSKLLKPRTRFAPSPTGALHIGTARTALFNYVFAKKYGGAFILRIEDTDIERSDPKWETDILENLKWLGIELDEGPRQNLTKENLGKQAEKHKGEYGPYRQSERIPTYAAFLEKLLKEDRAYYCFCSDEELKAKRQYQISIGQTPSYDGKCAKLSKEEVKKYLAQGKPSVIRFKIPVQKVFFSDLIRGKLEFNSALIGDFVVAKNLAAPLYNFAVVIDDCEMKISHVIRGEDHISNTPKQILIQEALGFSQPKYAHLPLILGPDRSKMSKRHGDVALTEYRKQGYLPEAIINFIAFLGWNPGTEKEIFSLPDLIKEFSLERVQKGGAIFNIKRLDYLNRSYIRQKSIENLVELCIPYLIEVDLIAPVWGQGKMAAIAPEPYHIENYKVTATDELIGLDYLIKIIGLYRERLKKLSEIVELSDFFFKDVLEYNKEILRWKELTDKEIFSSLEIMENVFSEIKAKDFNKEVLEKILMTEAEKAGDRGKLLWPLRVALTGKEASAGPFEVAEVLGKEKSLKRIKKAKELIKQ